MSFRVTFRPNAGVGSPRHHRWLGAGHLARGTGPQLDPSASRNNGMLRVQLFLPRPLPLPFSPVRPAPSREPRPSQGPDRPPLYPLGTRMQIPVGPRSAKSARRDGKLQQYWPLGPPPALSRNSRPWTLAPQLIHSRGAGPPPHAGTDVRTRAPVRPRTGRAPEQVARLVSMGPMRPALTVRLLRPLPRRVSPELWCPAASALPCFGFCLPSLRGRKRCARQVPPT